MDLPHLAYSATTTSPIPESKVEDVQSLAEGFTKFAHANPLPVPRVNHEGNTVLQMNAPLFVSLGDLDDHFDVENGACVYAALLGGIVPDITIESVAHAEGYLPQFRSWKLEDDGDTLVYLDASDREQVVYDADEIRAIFSELTRSEEDAIHV